MTGIKDMTLEQLLDYLVGSTLTPHNAKQEILSRFAELNKMIELMAQEIYFYNNINEPSTEHRGLSISQITQHFKEKADEKQNR